VYKSVPYPSEVELPALAEGGGCGELRAACFAHRPPQLLLEHLFQFAVGVLLEIAAAHGVNAVEILGHIGPVLVDESPARVAACSPRCCGRVSRSVRRPPRSRSAIGSFWADRAHRRTNCSRRRGFRCRGPLAAPKLVVPLRLTSSTRRIGRALCQYWPIATRARSSFAASVPSRRAASMGRGPLPPGGRDDGRFHRRQIEGEVFRRRMLGFDFLQSPLHCGVGALRPEPRPCPTSPPPSTWPPCGFGRCCARAAGMAIGVALLAARPLPLVWPLPSMAGRLPLDAARLLPLVATRLAAATRMQRASARINSSLRISCQPGTRFFRAISARFFYRARLEIRCRHHETSLRFTELACASAALDG